MIKNILYLSILTILIVLFWIGLNVYHNSATSTISQDTNIRIIPITPSFDTKTIDALKTRKTVSVDLREKISTPAPSLTIQPTLAQPTPTQAITQPTPTSLPSPEASSSGL